MRLDQLLELVRLSGHLRGGRLRHEHVPEARGYDLRKQQHLQHVGSRELQQLLSDGTNAPSR